MWSHPVGRVRMVGMLEGLSFLLLLGVAMPLKYLADMPDAVRIVGMAHGVLFLALGYLAIQTKFECEWPVGRMVMVMAASLVPFGPFLIDGRLKKLQVTAPEAPEG